MQVKGWRTLMFNVFTCKQPNLQTTVDIFFRFCCKAFKIEYVIMNFVIKHLKWSNKITVSYFFLENLTDTVKILKVFCLH